MTTEERNLTAIFVAGQLAGLAISLDVQAFEEFLSDHPTEFGYESPCRAAIRFAKSIREERKGS